jgi:hypothetical protein
MALLVWQDRLRDNRENQKYTQGFTFGGGVSKIYGPTYSFNIKKEADPFFSSFFIEKKRYLQTC